VKVARALRRITYDGTGEASFRHKATNTLRHEALPSCRLSYGAFSSTEYIRDKVELHLQFSCRMLLTRAGFCASL
jgi:hypothetical protein